MQNLFGILDSQSRFELQAKFLFNPYKLETGSTNRYGEVLSNGDLFFINNVTNEPGDLGKLTQSIGNVPNLFENSISGKNAIRFNVAQKRLDNQNTTHFKPLLNQEFWVAFKALPYTSAINRSCAFFYGELDGNSLNAFFSFNSSDNTFNVEIRTRDSGGAFRRKFISVDCTINDINIYDIIVHISSDEDANNWNVYFGDTLQTKTVNLNQSWTGTDPYPGLNNYTVRIGASLSQQTQYYSGLLGKVMGGYGTPNVRSIHAALNSSQ